jgi:hypothetical protein
MIVIKYLCLQLNEVFIDELQSLQMLSEPQLSTIF